MGRLTTSLAKAAAPVRPSGCKFLCWAKSRSTLRRAKPAIVVCRSFSKTQKTRWHRNLFTSPGNCGRESSDRQPSLKPFQPGELDTDNVVDFPTPDIET